jgi:hypothetical protein
MGLLVIMSVPFSFFKSSVVIWSLKRVQWFELFIVAAWHPGKRLHLAGQKLTSLTLKESTFRLV